MKNEYRASGVKLEELAKLLSNHPQMQEFLEGKLITGIPHIKNNTAILFLDNSEARRIAYKIILVNPYGKPLPLGPAVQEVVRRSLETNLYLNLNIVPRLQRVAPPGFHEEIIGLIKQEFIEGTPLNRSTIYQAHPHLAIRDFAQLEEAITTAHELGVIFRDIKPSNIIRNKRGLYFIDQLPTTFEQDLFYRTEGRLVGTPKFGADSNPQPIHSQDHYALATTFAYAVLGLDPRTLPTSRTKSFENACSDRLLKISQEHTAYFEYLKEQERPYDPQDPEFIESYKAKYRSLGLPIAEDQMWRENLLSIPPLEIDLVQGPDLVHGPTQIELMRNKALETWKG
jgi:serine/threonine protein kinase